MDRLIDALAFSLCWILLLQPDEEEAGFTFLGCGRRQEEERHVWHLGRMLDPRAILLIRRILVVVELY